MIWVKNKNHPTNVVMHPASDIGMRLQSQHIGVVKLPAQDAVL